MGANIAPSLLDAAGMQFIHLIISATVSLRGQSRMVPRSTCGKTLPWPLQIRFFFAKPSAHVVELTVTVSRRSSAFYLTYWWNRPFFWVLFHPSLVIHLFSSFACHGPSPNPWREDTSLDWLGLPFFSRTKLIMAFIFCILWENKMWIYISLNP